MSLKETLDKWAADLSKKAAEKGTTLQESTDAFKAVTAYYAAQQKRAKKTSEDDEETAGGFNFAGSDEVIHGSGVTKVRASRNS